MPGKAKTIKLNQGGKEIDYAKVSARLAIFLEENKAASVRTEYDFKEGWVIFKATIFPDCANPYRSFNGTSFGKVGSVNKAFEKLETIAVGRALAFAGYLSSGEIASPEEMEIYYEDGPVVDVVSAIEKLTAAKTTDELAKVWRSLTAAEREAKEVSDTKESVKQMFKSFEKDAAKVDRLNGQEGIKDTTDESP